MAATVQEAGRKYPRTVFPAGPAVLFSLGTPPKRTTATFNGEEKSRLSFWFRAVDRMHPDLVGRSFWHEITAIISTGRDGNTPSEGHKFLQTLTGKPLGAEWNFVHGWDMTEEEWAPLYGHYLLVFGEPTFKDDGSLRKQKITQIINPKVLGVSVDTRAVDISQPGSIREFRNELERQQLGMPIPVPLLGTRDEALTAVADLLNRKNGFGRLARAFIDRHAADRVSALTDDGIRHLRVLLQIYELSLQSADIARQLEENLNAFHCTLDALDPYPAVTLLLACRKAAQQM